MLRDRDASSSGDENLDFGTLSPLQQPAQAAPRPDPSYLHFTLSESPEHFSPLWELKAGEPGLCNSSSSEKAPTMLVDDAQWIPAIGEQSWKSHSSEEPGNTIHRKPGGPETKLCFDLILPLTLFPDLETHHSYSKLFPTEVHIHCMQKETE